MTVMTRTRYVHETVLREQPALSYTYIPRVVIVGGGLGGVTVASRLKKQHKLLEVVLVNENCFYEFKPRLYEWMTGKKSIVLLDNLFPQGDKVQLIEGRVTEIKTADTEKFIVLESGRLIPYDYLVLATGSITNFFGTIGADEESLPLDNYYDIKIITGNILNKLELAAKRAVAQKDPGEFFIFQVIGAGPTGIELAFELEYFIKQKVNQQFTCLKKYKPTIQIIEATGGILPGFDDAIRDYVIQRLDERGIDLVLNTMVVEVQLDQIKVKRKDPNTDTFSEEYMISVDPIWVAGVKANCTENMLTNVNRAPRNERIMVTPQLKMENFSNIFVIGDVAGSRIAGTDRLYPPTGQVVQQQAAYVSQLLLNEVRGKTTKTKPFVFEEKGRMLALGPEDAVISANLPGPLKNKTIHLKGWVASLFRNVYYRFKMWSKS